MKQGTRKILNTVKNTLTIMSGDVHFLLYANNKAFENMSEDMQDSEEGKALNETIDKLLYLMLSMKKSIKLIEDIVKK